MDLDDLDGLSQVPSRASKFAPRSSKFKPQTKPKAETSSRHEPQVSTSKPEIQESVSAPKPEPQNIGISWKMEEGEEIKAKVNATAKPEPSASYGSVKMEVEAKAVAGAVAKQDDYMEIDQKEEEEEEEEAEEDMIVREIDVFFTPSMDANTKLYVMQYPLRPCWRPYELDERCKEVRVKPVSAEVEMDLSIDDSMNWDSNSSISQKTTKQTLSSKWLPSLATGYAAGVLIGNKLHLNPIHAVVQLRPSLGHSKSDPSKKNNVTYGDEVTVKLEDNNEGKPIGPSKKQNKRIDSVNEQKSDVEECWIPLKYHSSKSDISSTYLQKMVAQESSPMDFTMSPYDYMSSLCPGVSDNSINPKGPSRRFLLSLPLEERVKKLLLEGPPIRRFVAFKHFAPDDSIEKVLEVLRKYGQLVQGLWAPRTSLLFPNPKPNEINKIAARDYVLLQFTKNLVISSSLINVPVKAKEDVKSFLKLFAVEIPSSKEWKFKEKRDASFIELYPHVVEEQGKLWDAVETKLLKMFTDGRNVPGTRTAITKPTIAHNPVKSLNSDKSATKTTSGAHARMTITADAREALRKALPKVFQNHKVCSFQLICQSLRDLAISQSTLPKADPRMAVAAASCADALPEELQQVISEVATNIHGFYVLKSSPDHPEHDPLRKVVIDLLLARGPNAKLKKAEVLEAARLSLKRDVTNNEYNKVMTDFCESKGSAWALKSGDGKP